AARAQGDAWHAYLKLREINPAPFAAYLDLPDGKVLCSSPELFLRVTEGRVVTKPIKGTRPRSSDPSRDRELADELRAATKDRAENVMIVDLLRNDLSRVCLDHSVQVPELCRIERYATVHHLVSTVVGRLRPGLGPVDLLRAAWPGGSITGAPKVRAMEVIAELEPTRRGVYTGSLGYFSAGGAMDTSIAIRTFVVRGRRACFQAGAGIVADSDPEREYDETLDKARGMVAALWEEWSC
ncbi:MAG TPA: anthranilate synthase component I family protein, partial [Vicinamibacteria bacterium]